MKTRRSRAGVAVALAVATGGLLGVAPALFAREGSHAQIERGRYLAQAGDCAACHTAEGGPPL